VSSQHQPLWRPLTGGLPFFAASAEGTRERSGSDVLFLVASLLLGAVLAATAVPSSGFETALIGVVDEVPSTLDMLWRLGVAALLLWVLTILVTAVVRRRGEVLVDVLLTSLAALGLAMLVARWLNGSWPSLSEVLTGGSTGTVPLAVLALGVGVSFAASPHLSLPFRRFGRWCVGTAAASVVLLGATTPTGALLSLLTAVAAASTVHLVLGSRVGRASLDEVREALAQVDLPVAELHESQRASSGVLVVEGTDLAGTPIVVKVHGRDARDTQLLARLWRSVWYRDAAPPALSRQQQVEHEGFVTMLAAARGVPAPQVVVAGSTDSKDALVVLTGGGTSLADLDGSSVHDDDLAAVWSAVARLHSAGMAHGSLTPRTFDRRDGEVLLTDLSPVTLVPSEDQRRTDQAQTLVSTAIVVGIERAVVVAAEQLGDDGVEHMLAYLQVPAMSIPLRRAVRDAGLDLDALRSAAAGVVGVEEPEIAELRRVSPRTLLMIALLVMVAAALITALGEVDLQDVVDTLREADPVWLAVALVLAQLPFFTQAVATRGACPRPLPYGPVAMLQVAIAFVALAVPSTAGRLAMDIRFFQRQGVPAPTALSISGIDSFSGFLVQMALLLLTLVFGVGAVDMTLSLPQDANIDGLLKLLAVVAVLLVVGGVLALALPKVRSRLLDRVRPLLTEVLDTFRGLRSLGKVLQLFGGNLANQILYAAALGACLAAFGGQLNLATLIVVYVAAALFGGMMPVPGGIGVVEAAIIAGLVAAGIDNAMATATALVFRLVTFYLPPLWGWGAVRWLERRSYL
jgi:uncharacterized protein (TIRG00374 family)